MTDILLIQPPIRDFYLTAKRTVPYGLACLASSLIREGFEVRIFDSLATSKSRVIPLPPEMEYLRAHYGRPDRSPFALFHLYRHYGHNLERIGREAKESGAFLVGISSLFTAYSEEALDTARAVKRFFPECRIVLGGHHPTELPNEVMQCRAVDYVIRGEGEAALPQLARALCEGGQSEEIESVPGIVFRKADASLHISPPAIMQDPDKYPSPALHLIDHHFYQRRGRSSLVVVTSRGCPQKCTYCSVGGSSYITCRRRSLDAVLGEIEEGVARHSAGFIDFEDENVSMHREWLLTLLKELQRRFGHCGLELRAMNGLFPPTLDREMILAMKDAGFRALNLSLATTSKPALRRFRRPDVTSAFERAVGHAHECGLQVVGYIIVGAPGQDPLSSVDDLLFLAARPALAGVSVYYPAPGSADYEGCIRAGILPHSHSLMRSTAIPVSDTTSREETVTLLRLGRILNFIKLLQERGCSLSSISSPANINRLDVTNRMEAGKALVSSFLDDTVIRGISPEGEVFEHQSSAKLTSRFRDGIRKMLTLRSLR